MSRIDELIAEFCPDGIEFRPIDDVISSLRTGLNPRQNFKLNPPGATNFYMTVRELGGFDLRPTAKTDRVDDDGLRLIQNRAKLRPGDVLFSATGTIGRTALVRDDPHDWNIKEGVYAITPRPECINPRFMIYLLHSSRVRAQFLAQADGSTVASIPMAALRRLSIPVPPLEVQREIVRVLDQFTQLEAELEAELEARRRQYEHYLHAAILPDGDLEWTTLGDATSNHDRKRKPVTRSDRKEGEFPYYGANGIQDYVHDFIFDGTFLLVGEDGSVKNTNGTPVLNWASGKIWVNNHAHVLTASSEQFSLRYLYYYLATVDVTTYVTGGTQPKINQKNLNSIPVPVVARDFQDRVVEMLDRFDALVNDISIGLPAELAARRKQYEYYRDKLLTFEEAAA